MTFDIHAIAKSICVDPIVEAQRIATDCDGEPRVERLTPEPVVASGHQYYSEAEKPYHCSNWTQLSGRSVRGYWMSRDYTKQPVCVILDFADGMLPRIGCLTHDNTTCEAVRAVAFTESDTRARAQGA